MVDALVSNTNNFTVVRVRVPPPALKAQRSDRGAFLLALFEVRLEVEPRIGLKRVHGFLLVINLYRNA